MSAAVAWDLRTAPARVPVRPVRPSRPRLVLVPTGDAVPARRAAPFRLTRAGRLAITLAVTLAVAAALVVAVAGTGFGGDSAGPVADHATTVQRGQTLSEIAAQQLPQLPVSQGVVQIQLANDLSSPHVHAGQTLVIPRVR